MRIRWGHRVRMVADVVNQMRGRAGKRQLKKADFGLTHTLGGPGSIACVFVWADRKYI